MGATTVPSTIPADSPTPLAGAQGSLSEGLEASGGSAFRLRSSPAPAAGAPVDEGFATAAGEAAVRHDPERPELERLRARAPRSNQAVSERLREAADLLALQGAAARRVEHVRAAARTIDGLTEPLLERAERGGRAAIEALPGVGAGLAAAIDELLRTGRFAQLERLQGAAAPERLFCAIPGVGPTLARRIYDRLHIDTLEGLELAAHDGTLEAVAGMGPRRVRALQITLASLLSRLPTAPGLAQLVEPSVATLLDVDAEYRRRAERSDLPRIAPTRFNPDARAWLPILHTERGTWQFTALYSNTARAHQLGKTHDWVLVYFHDDLHAERLRTIVTESRGQLSGMRVVRGREEECERLHAQSPLLRASRRLQ